MAIKLLEIKYQLQNTQENDIGKTLCLYDKHLFQQRCFLQKSDLVTILETNEFFFGQILVFIEWIKTGKVSM